MSKQSRADLIETIQYDVAEFQHLTDTYDDAAAALFGVNRTDLRLIGLLSLRGPLTAGELAEGAALSPAATTTAIQRIVEAGHATREPGAEDRRRAVIDLTPKARRLVEKAYTTVAEAARSQLESYGDRELRTLHDFLSRGNKLLEESARSLRRSTRSRRT